MKHIGWCLEKIQVEIGGMPRILDFEGKKKASKIISNVRKYLNTLADLIHNHKFKKSLHELLKAPIEGIRLQAHEVEELVKDLEHALYIIDLNLTELEEINKVNIFNADQVTAWCKSYDKIALMIDQKFGGERGDLRKEFQLASHTKEQLKELVKSEEHLAEFLK